ncbi:MAG: hypothetical protein L0Y67_06240 [Gammaproteobacteria bacterium]|nr:hypothetical protein [Gammaproteobacteria bacterium]
MIDNSSIWHWGTLGAIALFFLPGAWITFGFRLTALPFWAKLLAGAILSPVVICIEFYTVRLLGFSFAQVPAILVAVNLPAVLLLWNARRELTNMGPRDWASAALIVLICCACMLPLFYDPERRLYMGHAWTYADAAYAFARGDLIPDDTAVAGYRMGYPVWLESIYRAVLSSLLDSPPMYSHALIQLGFLIATYAFAAGLVSEFGGGSVAQLLSGVWLFFATNPVGDILRITPGFPLQSITGDPRYTPWVLKFFDFNPMPLVLPAFLAVAYLFLFADRRGWSSGLFAVLGLLILSGCLFYPLLMPAFFGLIGSWILVCAFTTWRQKTTSWKPILSICAISLLTAVLVFAQTSFFTEPRVVRDLVHIYSLKDMLVKAATAVVVLMPTLLGVLLALRDSWIQRRRPAMILLIGGLTSLGLHSVFFLPYWYNEYKFIFTAAICLMPFPCVVVQSRVTDGRSRFAIPAVGLLLTFIVLPGAIRMATVGATPPPNRPRPKTDVSSFFLRLQPGEPLASLCNAIREQTPSDAVLVTVSDQVHFPTLTLRSLYIPPTDRSFAGINQEAGTQVALIKGFGWEVVKQRRATLAELFGEDDPSRATALSRILERRRPVVILIEKQHSGLQEWLREHKLGGALFERDEVLVWMVPPQPAS